MKEIPLTRGKVAIVDDADCDWLSQWKWCAGNARGRWYAKRTATGRVHVYMHRVILGIRDPLLEADHIDGNGLNNCRNNLRISTHSENLRNQFRKTTNKSGFIGVTWQAQRQKWKAQIKVNGKNNHLGLFDNPKDAAIVRDAASIEMHGSFARLNFPIAGRPQWVRNPI